MGNLSRLVADVDSLARLALADAELTSFAEYADVTIGISDGRHAIALRVTADGVVATTTDRADVVMVAPEEAWDSCLEARPAPTLHHFLAMRMRVAGTHVAAGTVRSDGDAELVFAQHAHIARRLVELARATLHGEPEPTADPALDRSGIRGRYVPVEIEGRSIELHVEEAGNPSRPALVVLTRRAPTLARGIR